MTAAMRPAGCEAWPYRLQLGALRCAIQASHHRYAAMVGDVYGTPLDAPAQRDERPPDIVISIREEVGAVGPAPTDRLTARRQSDACVIESDPITCRVRPGTAPVELALVIRDPAMPAELLAYHAWIVLNRALLVLDRVVLHAAALAYRGTVSVFAGERGVGKSTLSIALARAGAEILADDHVLARQAGGRTLVSGCHARMRVTARTEQHFLKGRLGRGAVDVGGLIKKEFPAHEFFAACPYQERAVDRWFFPRVGARFAVRPIGGGAALLRLMRITGPLLRFHDRADYDEFLSMLAGLVARVPCHELELSPRLEDLDRLVELLDRET